MKFKYYLRGLGVGIIISTIILMIAYSGHKVEISDEEVIKRAEALGMVMKEESLFPHFKEHNDTQIPNETEQIENTEKSTETEGDIATEVNVETETDAGIKTDSEVETEKLSEQNVQEDTRQKYHIIIPTGSTPQFFSNELEQNGVIENASSLVEYLREMEYLTKIRVGEYDIPYGATNEEVYEILKNGGIVNKVIGTEEQ